MNERSSQNKTKMHPYGGMHQYTFSQSACPRFMKVRNAWNLLFFLFIFFGGKMGIFLYVLVVLRADVAFFFRTDSDWCWGLPRSTDWRSLPLLPDPTIPVAPARFQIYELQALDRDEADLELHLRRDWMKDDLRSVPRGHWPIDPPCSGGGGDGDEVSEIIGRFFAEVCESCHWNLETFRKIASFFWGGDQLLGVT